MAVLSFEIVTLLLLEETSSIVKEESNKEIGPSTLAVPFTYLRIYFILGVAV